MHSLWSRNSVLYRAGSLPFLLWVSAVGSAIPLHSRPLNGKEGLEDYNLKYLTARYFLGLESLVFCSAYNLGRLVTYCLCTKCYRLCFSYPESHPEFLS